MRGHHPHSLWHPHNNRLNTDIPHQELFVPGLAAAGKKLAVDASAGVYRDCPHILYGVLLAVQHQTVQHLRHVQGGLRRPLHHVRNHQLLKGGRCHCA